MSNKHFSKKYEKKGVFEKSRGYRAACRSCGKGYHNAMWQAHHVLPGTTVSRATIEEQIKDSEKVEYIEGCKWITDWDLNEKYNLIGLPTIWDYILAERISGDQKKKELIELSGSKKKRISRLEKLLKNFVGPIDLPAHQPVSWGHTDFNDEVMLYLKKEVWDPLKVKKKEHEIEPESIKSKLDKSVKSFQDKLQRRGRREGGTEKNWPKRLEKGNNTWFHPFSMASDDDLRAPF